jgi:hypothetical protein
MRSAYGRDASICCCALRIFDAATFSMALVIFCMFLTEEIFERISFSPGIYRISKKTNVIARSRYPRHCEERSDEAIRSTAGDCRGPSGASQ